VQAESAKRAAQRPIALVGFMGAGKSKIGRMLAKRLELPFIDTDKAIEEAAGCSVADIFREYGEARFREAERSIIVRLLNEEPRVIGLGGGAFVNESNRAALNKGARTVWLDPPFEFILPRIRRSTDRPLASSRSDDELRALWVDRRSHYAHAHARIRTWDANPVRIVDRIVAALVVLP
jgi:shikimate kinase